MTRIRNVVLLAAIAAAAMAASPAPLPSGAGMMLGVWHLKTSSLDWNFKTGDFSAPSKVVLTRQGGDVTADRANGNYTKQIATLYGNVVMHDLNGTFAGLAASSVSQPRGPATLTTDELHIDWQARVYTAVGHVHYIEGNTTVDADRGMLNDVSHMLYISGNARVTQGLRSLVADRIDYNTLTGLAHAQGNVTAQFPSSVQPHIATPKPIRIPGIRRTPAP